jgi:truncated hemoglobin YjbI
VRRLIDHQARFISSATGGPVSYSDEHLRRVHQTFGITTHRAIARVALRMRRYLERRNASHPEQ